MGDKKVSVNGIKNWFHDTKKKVTDTAKSAANWVAENPVTTAIIVGCVSSMASKGYRTYKIHDENVRRERSFYDNREGRYSRAKRNLKHYELDEIETRYHNGESYHHILMDMDLLK